MIDYQTIVDKCGSHNSKPAGEADWARKYAKEGKKQILDDDSIVYYYYKRDVDTTYVLVIDNMKCETFAYDSNAMYTELDEDFKNL